MSAAQGVNAGIKLNPKRQRLEAFVSFPSPYTQTLIVQALVKLIRDLSISLVPPEEDSPPALQWADYDLLSFTYPHSNPSTHLTSSYVYRKALIRKHQLHSTITEYLAKARHRGNKTVLEKALPVGWTVELRFADELEEALLDELGELRVGLEENEGKDEEDRRWYILKPGFADRAQGIRIFSTLEELQKIFESFEEESDDEDDEEEEEDEDEEEEGQAGDDEGRRYGSEDGERHPHTNTTANEALERKTTQLRIGNDADDDESGAGTGVLTSHLRHFVIQEYLPRPILFDTAQIVGEPPAALIGSKFHLRAYVLVTGGYTVHLSRTMLVLFSGSAYTSPRSSEREEMDLTPHLTNTCLQTDAYGAPAPPEDLIKLFWELEELDAIEYKSKGYHSAGKVSKEWLDSTFAKVGEVIGESVKAGAECGSFGLQLVPNAFEVFGVDLLLSFPDASPSDMKNHSSLPIPKVTLLEYNASPNFHQSGQRLKNDLAEMFQGIVRISVAPFFGIDLDEDEDSDDEDEKKASRDEDDVRSKTAIKAEEKSWDVGDEKWGWRLVGRGEVRGNW